MTPPWFAEIKRFNLHFIYRLLREWAKGHGGQISDNDGGPLRNLQVQRGTTHLREASLSGTQLSCLEDCSRSRRVLSALSRWKELHNFHYPMMNLASLHRNYLNYSIRIASHKERKATLLIIICSNCSRCNNFIVSLLRMIIYADINVIQRYKTFLSSNRFNVAKTIASRVSFRENIFQRVRIVSIA